MSLRAATLGLQWQWHANPQTGLGLPEPRRGLRCASTRCPCPPTIKTSGKCPICCCKNCRPRLLRPLPSSPLRPAFEGEKAGLLVMGLDYAYVAITHQRSAARWPRRCARMPISSRRKPLRPRRYLYPPTSPFTCAWPCVDGAKCQFSYSLDGQQFHARRHRVSSPRRPLDWGANGLVLHPPRQNQRRRHSDVDWFRVE